jgi:hypothetical protein
MTTQRSQLARLVSGLAAITLLSLVVTGPRPTLASSSSDGPLAATFEAHGGLDRWQAQRTFSYVLDGFPLSPQVAKRNRSTVDLRNRYNRIEGDGFVVGWDGEQAWADPGPDAVGLKPRFFALGSFYFIGMPFVFGDDGVVLEEKGYGSFDGKTYWIVQVGYDRGIGHSAEDDYTLFIDPDTNRLALINHSVTETDVERVTWVFDEWQEVNGLVVPSRMTFHQGWNPENPGDGATFTITDVEFDTAAPDPAIYAAPESTR